MIVILKTGDRIKITQEMADRLYVMIVKSPGAKQWQFFTVQTESVVCAFNLNEVAAIVREDTIEPHN